MIGHGRHRQLDPLARILLALPVQRLMVGVFLHQHHRQQARAGKAARDRVERRRRLRDRLAGPATELLPHMLGHEPLPGDDVERLGDILADLGELAPAAARTRRRRRVNNPSARQVGREVAPRPRAPREALHLDARRLGLRLILARRRSQFLELQFQLIDKPLAALGARTEHRALHLRDRQLQMRNQRFRTRQLGARLNQRRFQRQAYKRVATARSIRRRPRPMAKQTGHAPAAWRKATCQRRHAPENLYQRTVAPPENVQIAGVRVALQRLLNLQGQAPHSAPHVGMAGRNPYPNPGRKRDHRAASALMIADAKSWGAVAAMRTRMSRPSSISNAGAPAVNRSFGSGATTTAANPGEALRRSFRQR